MAEDPEVDSMKSKSDNPNDVSQSRSTSSQTTYQTSADYFKALEKWLQDVYMWQSIVASFPYMVMSNQFLPNISNPQHFTNNVATPNGVNVFHFAPPVAPYHVGGVPNPETLRNRHVPPPIFRQGQGRQNNLEGIEYRIPPIWKRFVAEFLDFLILFLVKLAVTFIAVDFFDIIDLDKYDLDLLNRNTKLDYKMAVEMTSEILMLEMIHRVVVCIFEACWLRRGVGGRVGGATPGKALMNIRVVLCERVSAVEGRPADIVLVYPGTDPGLFWAFSRSFVKNLVLSILFPVCFALFFFKYSRTGYDILCRTIVVEDAPRPRA